ncbi:ABC transporter ATP-binding protein [Devriesea agamarum]|uniref:ABC transporter ATP-binding protein n=1 Tax=Devriesea agamarum TaxID=472569 RepID=UPI00071D131B|nr:ATP-binding cassette domain-containing protein [Devriesea agamarum]
MITIEHLVKRYGSQTVIDDLTFACEPGTVTGFLGPNGAGKSTTLRALTGLTRPSSGLTTVAGQPYHDLPNPPRVVGVMLDASAIHPGRTGIETLRLAARYAGVDSAIAPKVLERVGLSEEAGRKRVRKYSLGMRQRLGIGIALMGDPQVLILDEPANGLDPEGIRWMRHLLRGFADAGGTVLLSSHLLREVEATVDRLVVINGGRMIRQGNIDDLLEGNGVTVRATEPDRLREALERAGASFTMDLEGTARTALAAEDVGRLALRESLVLTSLQSDARTGLEELFFALTDADTALPHSAPASQPAAPTK